MTNPNNFLSSFGQLTGTLREMLMQPPSLGQRIKTIREERHLTLEMVSQGLCQVEYLEQVEAGVARPTQLFLTKLAQKLGLSSILDLLEKE